jgi:hypothetical protein
MPLNEDHPVNRTPLARTSVGMTALFTICGYLWFADPWIPVARAHGLVQFDG